MCAPHKKPRKVLKWLDKLRTSTLKTHNAATVAGKRASGGKRRPCKSPAVLIFCNKVKTVMFVTQLIDKHTRGLAYAKAAAAAEAADADAADGGDGASRSDAKSKPRAKGRAPLPPLTGATALHGQLPQAQREAVLAAFTRGDPQCSILVATDVAARGLHIPGLKYGECLPTDPSSHHPIVP